jgi:pyruvate dehydrogenase E2 component (dihydrolipoamide acetyltransferase)
LVPGGTAKAKPKKAATEEPAPAAVQAETATHAAPEAPSGDAISAEFPDGVKATPVARRIAADKSADLKQINGTGPGGRIVKADVEKFLASGGAESVAAPAKAETAAPQKATPAQAAPIDATANQTVVELTRLRKAIARRMAESKQTVPHFQVTTAIDMTAALALRKQINGSLPEGEKVSVNDLIVKGCGVALRSYPNINASWGGDKLLHNKQINVGTAVAVDGGLLTIVQHNTDKSSIGQVARENAERIGRARAGKVQAEDIQGSTFSVSNLGAFDVYEFTAIINPPEAAILAVGSANQEVVVRDGEMVIRNIMRVTLSADHRVTDGAEVAQFLQHLKGILETPMKLLV